MRGDSCSPLRRTLSEASTSQSRDHRRQQPMSIPFRTPAKTVPIPLHAHARAHTKDVLTCIFALERGVPVVLHSVVCPPGQRFGNDCTHTGTRGGGGARNTVAARPPCCPCVEGATGATAGTRGPHQHRTCPFVAMDTVTLDNNCILPVVERLLLDLRIELVAPPGGGSGRPASVPEAWGGAPHCGTVSHPSPYAPQSAALS